MNFEDGVKQLQEFIRTRPIILVGTGLSISMGLPGMKELLQYLANRIPELCKDNVTLYSEWQSCMKLIDLHGFEEGLSQVTISDELLEIITNETAEFVQQHDLQIYKSIHELQLSDFPFAKLIKHFVDSLHPENQTLNIITPNYDHLVEYACDLINVRCCTGFTGTYLKKFDYEHLKNDSYSLNPIPGQRGNRRYRMIPRVRLLKPHGSLYWQKVGEETFETYQKIEGAKRVIITPGNTKFKNSLIDSVMNCHREMANNCIQKANSILIYGYGFNDLHLQTVLKEKLRLGVNCLIMSKCLSPYARQLISSYKQILALEEDGFMRTKWYYNGQEGIWDESIWSLNDFVKKIL